MGLHVCPSKPGLTISSVKAKKRKKKKKRKKEKTFHCKVHQQSFVALPNSSDVGVMCGVVHYNIHPAHSRYFEVSLQLCSVNLSGTFSHFPQEHSKGWCLFFWLRHIQAIQPACSRTLTRMILMFGLCQVHHSSQNIQEFKGWCYLFLFCTLVFFLYQVHVLIVSVQQCNNCTRYISVLCHVLPWFGCTRCVDVLFVPGASMYWLYNVLIVPWRPMFCLYQVLQCIDYTMETKVLFVSGTSMYWM